MGQLERYGLYVLVLVIFLILGVAIWGGDAPPVQASSRDAGQIDPGASLSTNGAEAGLDERTVASSRSFDDLFSDLVDLPTGDLGSTPPPASLAGGFEDLRGLEDGQNGVAEGRLGPDVEPQARSLLAAPMYRTYVVRESETYSDIAKRELGRATAWEQIRDLNPGIDPKGLRIGQVIKLPPAGASSKVAGSAQQRRHTMKAGEYLGSISQQYYDTSRYAGLIREANNITDDRKIRTGTVLIIPVLPEKK